jgi:hypothetical protein
MSKCSQRRISRVPAEVIIGALVRKINKNYKTVYVVQFFFTFDELKTAIESLFVTTSDVKCFVSLFKNGFFLLYGLEY